MFSGDLAVRFSSNNTELLKDIEQTKGIIFIALSSLLIYLICIRPYRKMVTLLKEYRLLFKRNKAIHSVFTEGIYELDVIKGRILLNESLSRIFGGNELSSSKARKIWMKGIHPDHRERVLKAFDKAADYGTEFWQEEYLYKANDGTYRDILHSRYFVRDEQKQIRSCVGAVQDLTKHRQVERKYHEQQLLMKNELSRTIIKTEEKERNRWAVELHDNIGQVLGVTSLYSGMLKMPETNVAEVSDKIKEMIDLSIMEIRHLSANLKPPRFEFGLKKDIETLAANIQRLHDGLEIEVSCENENRLNDEQKLMVYRIVQEQLNNTIKYAAATEVKISIRVYASKAEIIIADNGKGFDTEKINCGLGLKNIQNRLEVFHGSMELRSSPGNGCELKAYFPYNTNDN